MKTSDDQSGMRRRDALKSVLLALTAAPLAEETAGAQQRTAAPAGGVENRRDQPFDAGWRFHRGDAQGAERPEFDDAAWRTLDLPHDFSIEALPQRLEENGAGALWGETALAARIGPFDSVESEGGRSTGWVVGGIGWYRKRFAASAVPAGGQAEIVFDGVYMNSDVWLNGQMLGNHPYGYTAFSYDLTPHLRRDGENVLAVRVRNEGRNSRWYSGSGIYRHVWLNVTGEVRVPLWGICVTTPEAGKDTATVKVAVKIENRGKAARDVAVRIRLLDSKNVAAGTHEATQSVAAGGSAQVEQAVAVAAPQLWSAATPRMYRAEVDLMVGGARVDQASAAFGIRKIEVDAENGLRINGEAIKLKGGCLHHDNGLLGSATIDRAEERRVELMKKNGFNAIRTSHNPPSPAFLDACDRVGILVLDEAFDCWERQKNPQDYHLYFDDWWQRDVDAMVLRDRNHPSVIFWSIGNEIGEATQPRGVEIAKQLVDRIKSLDTTRPVTEAVNGVFAGGNSLDLAFQYLDVGGYNYMWNRYEGDHARLPQRVMMGTESFPLQAFQNWQLVLKHPYVLGDFVWTGMDYLGESSIGNAQLSQPAGRGGMGGPGGGGGGRGAGAAGAGAAAAGAPAATAGRGGVAPAGPATAGAPPAGQAAGGGRGAGGGLDLGGMVAMPGSGFGSLGFPWFNSYCGDIDVIGETKAALYYKHVVWGISPLEMAVQRPVPQGRTENVSAWGWSDELRSWTWPGFEGKSLKVRVYSTGDQVRLLLDGKEIGAKPVSLETELKAEFDVPYAPGELKAVAMSGGKQIAELAFKTAGKPVTLRLKADRPSIRRSRNDLCYVTLEVLDAAGQLVPDAVVPIRFTVSAAGELAAAGTANPKDVESFRQPNPKTFHGKALAIVRPKGIAGTITVRAEAEGLTAASVVVQVS